MIPGQHALARLGFGKGNPRRFAELLQRVSGQRIADPAAADHQRMLCPPDDLRGPLRLPRGGRPAVQMPHPLPQEGNRIVISLPFHILRHGQADRPGIRGIRQYSQRVKGRGHQLFRPFDPVKIVAYAPEGIGHRLPEGLKELRLLQHRIRLAAGKGIPRQKQQRNPVRGGTAGGRDHIHGSRSDGADAGNNLQAVFLLGEGGGRQRHVLLVLSLQEADLMPSLLQRLADAHHAAVAENAEEVPHKFMLRAVQLHILLIQETNQGLRHGQTNGFHAAFPPRFTSCLPSTRCPVPSPTDAPSGTPGIPAAYTAAPPDGGLPRDTTGHIPAPCSADASDPAR